MSKKNLSLLIAVPIIVVLLLVGYLFVQTKNRQAAEEKRMQEAKQAAELEQSLGASTALEVDIQTNPLEEKVPELNPVEKTNPFSSAYENPFE
jgi:flagellar basal body-associated protein FliL